MEVDVHNFHNLTAEKECLAKLLPANRPRTFRVRGHPFHHPKFKTEHFKNILSIADSSIFQIHIPN